MGACDFVCSMVRVRASDILQQQGNTHASNHYETDRKRIRQSTLKRVPPPLEYRRRSRRICALKVQVTVIVKHDDAK
jgi:hypothetical protein